MDYDTRDNRQSLIDKFPALQDDANFYISSPFTFQYNCIAWAMGMDDCWVDSSINIPWHWWPDDVSRDGSEDALVDAFSQLSFVKCSNGLFESGFDKVALYSKGGKWQHAARVTSDSELHSKFGASFDAHHSEGDVLNAIYGTIFQYMKRPISMRGVSYRIRGSAPGEIHTQLLAPDGKSYLVFYGGHIFDERGFHYENVGGTLCLV